MKTFACDGCGKEFGGPLDEIRYTDTNGVSHTFDLCVPCRKRLTDGKEKAERDFFNKILKGK